MEDEGQPQDTDAQPADKTFLLKRRLKEDTVTVPGIGTFRVRQLSRAESLLIGKLDGWARQEQKMVSLACLEPTFTEREVAQWQDAGGNDEVEMVSTKIGQLSGMVEKAGKQAYADFRGRPDD